MLKLSSLTLALALPIASATCYASSELNLALSSDIAALDYAHTNDDGGGQWGIGGLYNDDLSSSLAFFSFNVIGDAESVAGLQTGLGLKAVVHDTFQTAASLALGGKVRYAPDSWSGFGVEGGLYFAPDMLNSNDADQYFDIHARLTYNVNKQARVFIALQNIDIKYDDPLIDKVEMDNGANLGFTLIF